MSFSLTPLPPLSPSPTPTTHRFSAIAAAPRRREKRENHLRRKLPKPQEPIFPPPSAPPPPPHILVVEEESLLVEEALQEAEAPDPLPPLTHRWFPRPVVGLFLRFAALLTVQTAVAVWFLSRGEGVEEKSDELERVGSVQGVQEAMKEERVGSVQGVKEGLELEMKVLEIRALAREARASERGNADEKGGGESSSRGRIGGLTSGSKDRKTPEGFNRVEGRGDSEHSNVGTGGIRQIVNQNHVEKSLNVQEHRESSRLISETTKKIPGVKTATDSPLEDSSNVSNLHASSQTEIGRIETGNVPLASEVASGSSFLEDSQSVSSVRDDRSHLQPKISSKVLPVQNESRSITSRARARRGQQLGIQIEQSFTKDNQMSSTMSRNIKGRSESGSKISITENGSVLDKDKDSQFVTRKETWWLKLPYVLAIFLHRNLDRNAPKGLYSLKINSPEDDGSYTSYTVVFQDRVDATNFCYILESFFEDLGEFSADIVPLTIQELGEAVNSGTSEVIVVKKGQLRLYAGQPLTEVEAALRSLLD